MIAGDSLALQHFYSLFCSLLHDGEVDMKATLATRKGKPKRARMSFVLRTGSVVHMVQSDFLTQAGSDTAVVQNVGASYMGPKGMSHRPDESWARLLSRGENSTKDVLILSSGPHWGELNTFVRPRSWSINSTSWVASYATMTSSVLGYLAESGFKGITFYRTNFRPGCTHDLKELTSYPNWQHLASGELDDIWVRSACSSYPRLRVLNVSKASEQRRGEHSLR